jgi:predicted nuclease of predicted toxin-antitoxin system
MKFIVDAQLPARLKYWLIEKGHDAIHTNDFPKKHLTEDTEIINRAEKEGRIIVSKDSDFYEYNLLKGIPERILFVTIGNVVNKELLRLFELNFSSIEELFLGGNNIIEFDNESITVHA